MRREPLKIKTFFTAFCAISIFASAVSAQETEISRRDVPPAVLSAFSKDYPNAKVLEWEKEIQGGTLYYEAETVDGKLARNIMYSPDGSTAQVEEKVAPKDLPQTVTDAVKQQYPNATVRSANKVTHLDVTEYSLSMSGSAPSKLVLSSDGTIVSKEGKKALDRNQ